MISVQALRDFINDRLMAAAAEIFTVVERTVVQYEEKLEHQRRLLETSWDPRVKLHRTEVPQHSGWQEHLLKQETNYCLEEAERQQTKGGEPGLLQLKEEEQGPPQIEENEALSASQKEGRLLLQSNTLRQHTAAEPDTEVHRLKKYIDSESTAHVERKETRVIPRDLVDGVPGAGNRDECEKLLCAETRLGDVRKETELYGNMGTLTDKKISCELCGKSYSRHAGLLIHMRTHTGEKPYSCKFCGKSYSRQDVLMAHVKTHTGEKPYSCEICGKRFIDHGNLLRHLRSHTGEKPYSCETCGKSFIVHSHLLVHIRTHTGEKPYSCQTCGKSFIVHSHLLVHMRTHTGEKPYSCEICGKSFNVHGNMLRHMKIHRCKASHL